MGIAAPKTEQEKREARISDSSYDAGWADALDAVVQQIEVEIQDCSTDAERKRCENLRTACIHLTSE